MTAHQGGLISRIKRLTFLQIVIVIAFLAVAPWIVLFGGLALLGLKDAIIG